MAVSAAHLALRELSQQAIHSRLAEFGERSDLLAADVVELEDCQIGLAAVDARVGLEVLAQKRAVSPP